MFKKRDHVLRNYLNSVPKYDLYYPFTDVGDNISSGIVRKSVTKKKKKKFRIVVHFHPPHKKRKYRE